MIVLTKARKQSNLKLQRQKWPYIPKPQHLIPDDSEQNIIRSAPDLLQR